MLQWQHDNNPKFENAEFVKDGNWRLDIWQENGNWEWCVLEGECILVSGFDVISREKAKFQAEYWYIVLIEDLAKLVANIQRESN